MKAKKTGKPIEVKEKKENFLFSFLDQISFGKKFIYDEENAKEYNKYVINNFLSQFIDSVLHVNEVNLRPRMSNQMHMLYLMHSIRPMKRYSKFLKNDKPADIIVSLSKYYGVSKMKAADLLETHTQEQLKFIQDNVA